MLALADVPFSIAIVIAISTAIAIFQRQSLLLRKKCLSGCCSARRVYRSLVRYEVV